MIGKNLINLIKREQKMLIIQTEIMNKLKKNIQVGKVNFILILFYFFLINISSSVNAQENSNGSL